mgnify:CR=1 FL=1
MNKVSGLVLKIISVLSAIYAVTMGLLFKEGAMTFFTYLSVAAIGIVLAVFLVFDLTGKKPSRVMYNIKYVFTLCIFVTFLLFNTLLGPTQVGGLFVSWGNIYYCSFCAHVLTPVTAVIDFFVSDREYEPKLKEAPLAVLPLFAYVIFVMILSSTGYIWYSLNNEPMCAPYNFLNYKAPCGWFGFDLGHINSQTLGIGVAYFIIVMSGIFALIGLGMLAIKRKTVVKA